MSNLSIKKVEAILSALEKLGAPGMAGRYMEERVEPEVSTVVLKYGEAIAKLYNSGAFQSMRLEDLLPSMIILGYLLKRDMDIFDLENLRGVE